ncbi:hypothetical protein VNO80_04135 [Phaseolus coccineus]|uniref:Uncharacterized protein n=1 Tax=Phaseolus coccineus TaxID=3886 RepID=A0AAN9NSW2_PHACN
MQTPILLGGLEGRGENIASHSCLHDQLLEQRKQPGHKVYSITPQVYKPVLLKHLQLKGRALLGISTPSELLGIAKRLVISSSLGEPPMTSLPGLPSCNPLAYPPVFGDCWYNCTSEDISGEDKKHCLHKALGQTADWFRRVWSVEPVKGNLRLSGYSACGQDGGVQLPHAYVEDDSLFAFPRGSQADLVLLVTTRPTTGNTLAWAVACERDQWGCAIAGHVNVAPRHLTAEVQTLLSATPIHEVSERVMDEKIGRMVTCVVLPRNFAGLELEGDGGDVAHQFDDWLAGSHWEKRLLMNEIMTGSVDTRSVVSKMTLTLLEDSGWYKANYSMADQLDWGRNQGTEFVTSPCNVWKGAYHCNTTQFSGCTYNREAEGYCPILTYSGDLPQWARYFPQANKMHFHLVADSLAFLIDDMKSTRLDIT